MSNSSSYRDKLLEIAKIYRIKEVRNYSKARKVLTVPQLELLLKKNKVPLPINKKSVFRIKKKFDNFVDKSSEGTQRFIRNRNRDLVDLLNKPYSSNFDKEHFQKFILAPLTYIFLITIFAGGPIVKKFFLDIESIQLTKELNEDNLEFFSDIYVDTLKKDEEKKQELAKAPENKKTDDSINEGFLSDFFRLNTQTVVNYLDELDYSLEGVRKNKQVEPVYFTKVPRDLSSVSDVALKKDVFIRIVLPLIVSENNDILKDRRYFLRLIDKKNIDDDENNWIMQKLKEYKVTDNDLEKLKRRMDIIPVSIAIAQAAKESGWGTSRFAIEGNALFGQWTWSGNGIVPYERQTGKQYKILKFPILRASVKAYKNNLNTHNSYREFRAKRERLRNQKQSVSGLDLVHTLDNYAETGKEYTDILEKIIIQNALDDFDIANLNNSEDKEFNL
jgi:Bax protein